MAMTVFQPEPFEDGDVLGTHMSDLINSGVTEFQSATAFSCVLPSGHVASLSFTELGQYSDQVAAYIREDLGLRRGDVVAVQCVNSLAYPVLLCGLMKAGVTITNINPLYTPDETNHQLKDSGAKILFVIDLFGDRLTEALADTKVEKVYRLTLTDLFPKFQQMLLNFVMRKVKKLVPESDVQFHGSFESVLKAGARRLQSGVDVSAYLKNVSGDDILFYQYTGGTTGRSKGAELTHRNVTANVSQAHKRNKGIFDDGQHVMMLVLPLYHVYALAVGAMSCVTNGTHVVLVPVPRPLSNLKVVFDKFNITTMPSVNTLYLGLMQEDWFRKDPPKHLKYCFSGAAPLNPQTAEDWTNLTGAKIYEGYGLTESTCVVSSMPLTEEPKMGTCGRPIPGTKLRIVGEDGQDKPAGEPGELWISGPQIMKGYLGRPDATAETITQDGWLKTGDVAVIDEEGYLSIVDRMKDMVIVSGFNVYPTDVEDVLTRCDGVADAAVVGAPCEMTGEKLVAYVVPAETGLTEESVVQHCRDHLTNYKVPKIIVFIEELPKSPVGKVLRRELRKQALEDYTKS